MARSGSPVSEAGVDSAGGRGQGRLGNVAGALLLGGRSVRMGRDKARLSWEGEPWSTRAARLLDGLFEETLLVGGVPDPAAPGRRVGDPPGPPCALRGLVGALAAAEAERVVVIATDLPCLDADLLLALCAWPEADAVVPRDARGDHPLCAVYRREACLAPARSHLESGRLALHRLLGAVRTSRVPVEALGVVRPDGTDPLTNVNTPEDLAKLAGV